MYLVLDYIIFGVFKKDKWDLVMNEILLLCSMLNYVRGYVGNFYN